MFKNKIFLGILGLAILGIMFYSLSGDKKQESEKNYFEQIKEERIALDENLKKYSDSPIENKSTFTGLNYFEPDEKFKIKADFQVVSNNDSTVMMMTDNTKAELEKVAVVTFQLNGKNIKLVLFKEKDIFFLPFRDLTNGTETYGGGRYINIPTTNLKGEKILIDFNETHNFYCAYNHSYICPVPPAENKIDLAIRAGEKILKKD